MITFADTGPRDKILEDFNKRTCTEKSGEAFEKAVRAAVTEEVSKIPTSDNHIALEVKAWPAKDGGVKSIKIVAYEKGKE